MKTKIDIKHCKHFDPKTMMRKDTCPQRKMCESDYKNKYKHPCGYRILECLALYETEPCYYYED